MAQRSKVLTILPENVRGELDQKLVEGAFSDYRGLEAWLATKGFRISRGSLQRYGSAFEKRIAAITQATAQSKAMVEAAPDREGALGDALTRMVQEKIFAILMESTEPMSDGQLAKLAKAIADVGRSTIMQRRWAEEYHGRLEAQKKLAAEKISGVEKRGGLAPEVADAIRNALLDIDPS